MDLRLMARLAVTALAFAAILTSSPAAAQSPTAAPQTIDAAVRPGDTVVIDTSSGQVRKGRIFAVSTASVELLRNQRKEVINVSEIRRVRIEYADRVSDGAKRGAWAGLLVGFVSGGAIAASDCGTPQFQLLCSTGGFLFTSGFLAGVGAGTGALVGLFVDKSSLSSREVWRAQAGPVKVALEFGAAPGGSGVGVRIRW